MSAVEVERLVAMRDGGAKWMQIGREFRKQDGDCKAIYDQAKAKAGSAPPNPATGCHMDSVRTVSDVPQ